ncbi:hypothetical protein RHMOL_Rhmol10G0250600 [Rhododendron molle]|uniref:Uncharacterized protein n=1 Tax=Rhododendron molle TaxID=49168 RepID=A0ACC0M7Q2_RHOML|nr:hypothetical protein RHMOL_Rhmol10G0250600 [Rhododendron molle]
MCNLSDSKKNSLLGNQAISNPRASPLLPLAEGRRPPSLLPRVRSPLSSPSISLSYLLLLQIVPLPFPPILMSFCPSSAWEGEAFSSPTGGSLAPSVWLAVWLNLQGRLIRSIKLLDWEFLVSGRLFARFLNLIHVDVVNGCVISPKSSSGISLTQKTVSFHVDYNVFPSGFVPENYLLSVDEVDFGLRSLASGYPNLRKLMVINASELGLLSIAEVCPTLQELELHKCNDQVLREIAACQNLQILKLVGNVDGFYGSLVSDIGLTIMAQGCRRLVKLELSGCEGSYDGIKAIGQCCQMLEELTLASHRMEGGWLSALSYCENLKTLKFQSCQRIDCSPGPDEHLGYCSTLDHLGGMGKYAPGGESRDGHMALFRPI